MSRYRLDMIKALLSKLHKTRRCGLEINSHRLKAPVLLWKALIVQLACLANNTKWELRCQFATPTLMSESRETAEQLFLTKLWILEHENLDSLKAWAWKKWQMIVTLEFNDLFLQQSNRKSTALKSITYAFEAQKMHFEQTLWQRWIS